MVAAFAIHFDRRHLLHRDRSGFPRIHFRYRMQPRYDFDSYVAALGEEVGGSWVAELVHWKD